MRPLGMALLSFGLSADWYRPSLGWLVVSGPIPILRENNPVLPGADSSSGAKI